MFSNRGSPPALEPVLANGGAAEPPRPRVDATKGAPPAASSGSGRFAVLQLACWFGLLLAVMEVAARWALWRFFQKLPLGLTHPHVGWMTVTSDLLLYAAVGAVVAVVCSRLDLPLSVASALFALLFFYGLGDVLKVEQWYAALALAIGLAAAAARSSAALQALARRTLLPLAGLALALAAGIYGWSLLGEYRATAVLPAAAPGAPNVLLITLDTVRADHLGLYGYRRQTSPRLAEYAQRGVVFERAISTVSWTLPSHASLFTGHFPQEVFHDLPDQPESDWRVPMDGTLPTLAEYFDAHGYRTAGFVANWLYCDRAYGLGRGYTHYADYTVSEGQTLKSAYLTRTVAETLGVESDPRFTLARKDGPTVNSEFLRWLDGVHGRPFFAFLNYMDSHDPYDPPPAFADSFSTGDAAAAPAAPAASGTQGLAANRIILQPTKEDLRDKLDPNNYDRCLAALDHYIGQLLDELERRGLLNNTLVVITADHGEHLGEHHHYMHSETLYMPVIHVPLVVICPGRVPANVRVRGPASLRDVPATITDIVSRSGSASFPGTSLRSRWEKPAAPAEPAYSCLDVWLTMISGDTRANKAARLCSIVDDRYQYIEGAGFGFRELYDLDRDPAEDHNLADSPSQQGALKHCQAELAAFRR